MAKKTLPTNYVDDIMNVSANGKRKYRMIYNDDGTVSFEDVTPYEQVGSDYSAMDINTTNEAVNESLDKNKIVPNLTTINALTEKGYVPDALAVKRLNESLDNALIFRRKLYDTDDLNSITEKGIYYFNTGSIPKNAPYNDASVVEVVGSPSDATQTIQRVTRYGVAGESAIRSLGGTWFAWQYYVFKDYLTTSLNNVITTLRNENKYKKGDTYALANNMMLPGVISGGAKSVIFSISTDKLIEASGLTISCPDFTVRTHDGAAVTDVNINNYDVSYKISKNMINITVTSDTAFHTVNNIACVCEGAMTITFT